MLYSVKDREDVENLKELVSLESQVKAMRLQGRLGKQNLHEDLKKVFEPVTRSTKDVSEEVIKTITETSNNNNEALDSLNSKLLEVMNDRVVLATYLMSPLSEITNPENTSQFRFVKDYSSNRF